MLPFSFFFFINFFNIFLKFFNFFFVGMMTKFNQEMYVKMRSKKNEPLSNLGKRTVRVVGKGPPVTPIIPGIESMRTASLATLVEEISTPISKKPRLADKGNEKADSRLSNVWDDAGLAVEKVNEVVTVEDLKVFSGMPSNEVVTCHVHKLVQVMYLCNFSPFFLLFFLFLSS